VHLAWAGRPTEGVHSVYPSAFCIVAQGAKEVYIGRTVHRYDPDHYLLATVELPAVSTILRADPREPYLSLRLDLDPALVGSVMMEAGLPPPRGQADARAVAVSRMDPELRDACVRLLRLIGAAAEARVLAPLVKREIVFRLLMGEQGDRLRHLPLLSGDGNSIARAMELLRKTFDRPLSIAGLARELGMSSSGFHHHFRAITDMSPLQFQKQVRLQEARRLMVTENLDAASAGYRVGYGDPAHFSRDYKRHFGASPARDARRLRVSLSAVADGGAGQP